jgi:alpha-L-arabinofuranosidase
MIKYASMKRNIFLRFLICSIIANTNISAQESYELTLDGKKKSTEIQPTMYGIFFEDVNFGADGGLYAELVKNRSFDFPQNLMGWYTFGSIEVRKDDPLFDQNPTYLVLSNPGHKHKHTGIENEGFRGMGFKKDASYKFSVWAKTSGSSKEEKIRVELINSKNNVIVEQEVVINSPGWKKYEVTVESDQTEAKGRLRIFLASGGSVALEHVSLFPADTYKGRANGLREDLAQALEDLSPGVFRFPEGCIVEGTDLDTRYNWKKSVGAVENRPVNENRWHYTFTNRFFPDYFQSYGLGFYEYFLLSEDIGAEPLPVVNCGLACQFQNNDESCHVPVGELGSYIQDALDLIEFANGPVSSTWGKFRAEMGHPAPFNLKFIGVGNEQWGKEYTERLEPFVKAIRSKYPEIQIVGSSGPSSDGDEFDRLWSEMKRIKVDLVDEHYYKDPGWFLQNVARYDDYDRKGPAVFAGEYACHDHPTGKQNNFRSALYEAAFMTGFERNADVVHMCTYAPLFAHVDAWQWNPNLIWFDNLEVMKTPNYYVQQIYALNTGTNTADLTLNGRPAAGENGLYASAVFDSVLNGYIIKVVNTSDAPKDIRINIKVPGKNRQLTLSDCIKMQDNDLTAINTIGNPDNFVPLKTTAAIEGNVLKAIAEKYSFNIYKVKL